MAIKYENYARKPTKFIQKTYFSLKLSVNDFGYKTMSKRIFEGMLHNIFRSRKYLLFIYLGRYKL